MRLDWTPLDLPYRRGHFTISAERSDRARTVLVQGRDRGDAMGLGEAAPSPRVVGADTDAIQRGLETAGSLVADLDVTATDEPPTLPSGFTGPVACALDGVLLDLWAKRHEAPLWRLLGCDRPRVPTSATISLGAPHQMADEAQGHTAEGFGVLKIKLGAGVDADLACFQAVRAAAPRATLRVDGNEGWDLDAAVALLPAMGEAGVELIEQPLPRDAPHADLQRLTRLADEYEVAHILDEGVHVPADAEEIGRLGLAHGINLKLQKAGGLRSGLRVIRAAREGSLKVMVGCFIETWAGIALALQAAAHVDWVDLDGAWLLAEEPVVAAGGPFLERGTLTASDAPGLGIRLAPGHDTVFDEPTT